MTGVQTCALPILKDLKRRMRRKERFRSGIFDLTKLKTIRTVRDFDEVYTAPKAGATPAHRTAP